MNPEREPRKTLPTAAPMGFYRRLEWKSLLYESFSFSVWCVHAVIVVGICSGWVRRGAVKMATLEAGRVTLLLGEIVFYSPVRPTGLFWVWPESMLAWREAVWAKRKIRFSPLTPTIGCSFNNAPHLMSEFTFFNRWIKVHWSLQV